MKSFVLAGVLSVLVLGVVGLAGLPQVEIDVAKVQGSESCAECHAAAMEAWKQSTHFATFQQMHRKPRAKEIMENLGLSGSIKRNDLCYKCHYTSTLKDGSRHATSGVSCESCHGAAADWTSDALHHEKAKDATPADREAIYAKCEAAGMIRPANIYNVARNCFSCHTVPDEDLVNKGDHKAGSDFELVSWSQGEVLHNYQYSPDQKNRPASAERRRVLYVVGALTDLEFSLRGLARSTGKGTYQTAMYNRVNRALKTLDAIQEKTPIAEVADALSTLPRITDKPKHMGKLVPDRSSFAGMDGPAGDVGKAAARFVTTHDGSKLAAIDPLIPGADTYHGTPQP